MGVTPVWAARNITGFVPETTLISITNQLMPFHFTFLSTKLVFITGLRSMRAFDCPKNVNSGRVVSGAG